MPRRILHHTAIALSLTIAASAALARVGPSASAGTNSGVKYVHLDSEPLTCVAGQPVPCPPSAGNGTSNTLYVSQSPGPQGVRYTTVRGTSPDPNELWMGFSLEAKCRSTYRLEYAQISPGYDDFEGTGVSEEEQPGYWSGTSVPVNTSAKTLSLRHVDVHAPIEVMLEHHMSDTFPAVYDGHPGFNPQAWGEHLVSLDIIAGMDETTARAKQRTLNLSIDFHATVMCKGPFGIRRQMRNPASVPIRVVYEPAPPTATAPPAPRRDPKPAPRRDPKPTPMPTAPGAGLTAEAWVTQASLIAVPDPSNACRVHLSTTLVATRETKVSYRLVDELGARSPVKQITIDQTLTAFVSHPVDVTPPAAPNAPTGPTLVTPTAPGIGGITAAAPTAPRGGYRIEVIAPNQTSSPMAWFELANCQQQVDTPAPSRRAIPQVRKSRTGVAGR